MNKENGQKTDYIDSDLLFSKKTKQVFGSMPNTIADDIDYRRFIDDIHPKHNKKHVFGTITNIAALISIPLALITILTLTQKNRTAEPTDRQLISAQAYQQDSSWIRYVVNPGVKGTIVLPDGSTVWVNSNSTISCPAQFDSIERVVFMSGEAYFKILSDKDWPMVVKTSKDINVRVIGTEFNMKSYDNDPSCKITLVKGIIELSQKGRIIKINPNEEAELFDFEPLRHPIPKKVNPTQVENTSAWKDGFLVFDNTPMSEVIKIMERWYGVSFEPVNKTISSYKFTARFKTESITQVLDLLSLSSNISYSIKDNRVSLYFKPYAIQK